jgi:hypothetical protein
MERKECFGSLHEITDKNGFTLTESRPECRSCEELRDCLHSSKQTAVEKEEEDELRKQNMITQVIDLSQIISNELGECLLEFLNRIYRSPLGTAVFRNLLLFFEAPQDKLSFTMTIPISPSTLDLIQEEVNGHRAIDSKETGKKRTGGEFALQIVLIQRHFPRNKKANMGLIAYEVARLFSSEDEEIRQILQVLTNSEINLFKTMDVNQRIDWFMERWGFRDEFEAFRKEMGTFKQSE